MGGVIVALPLTSGPIAFFLVLEHGPAFAAGAALGSLAGALAQGAFCLGYAALAFRGGWPVAFAGGALAFAAVGVALQRLAMPLGAAHRGRDGRLGRWPCSSCRAARRRGGRARRLAGTFPPGWSSRPPWSSR